LTIASSIPFARSRAAASRGSSVPTATAHSSRLPTVIVACSTASPIRADASSRERQNVGR